jgi:RNA polymerase primary sigma factor
MHFVSTDETVDDTEDRRRSLTLVDPEPTPDVIFEGHELERVLRETVSELPSREQEIVRRRFGFGVPDSSEETLEQIGQDHGVTRERIRQIEAKALKRLAHPRRLKRLVDFKEY